jgi:hypothetical protein
MKFFNTQLIKRRNARGNREHMMGHKYHDPVRGAYYTPDPEDLKKVYVTYMEHVTISERLL